MHYDSYNIYGHQVTCVQLGIPSTLISESLGAYSSWCIILTAPECCTAMCFLTLPLRADLYEQWPHWNGFLPFNMCAFLMWLLSVSKVFPTYSHSLHLYVLPPWIFIWPFMLRTLNPQILHVSVSPEKKTKMVCINGINYINFCIELVKNYLA